MQEKESENKSNSFFLSIIVLAKWLLKGTSPFLDYNFSAASTR